MDRFALYFAAIAAQIGGVVTCVNARGRDGEIVGGAALAFIGCCWMVTTAILSRRAE